LGFGWGNDTFVCVHAGNMGHEQGLENVLAAAGLLRARPILFVLAGDGNERPRLERLAAERQLTNVVFLPPWPPGEYEALLRAADLLLVNHRASVGEMSLASKLTSYFAASTPVVAAVAAKSETAREVAATGASILARPDDPDALAAATVRLAAGDRRARAFEQSAVHYTRERLIATADLAEYERFVEHLTRNGR
jgi:glycosyltransferase involved in cell wall biosynthesis